MKLRSSESVSFISTDNDCYRHYHSGRAVMTVQNLGEPTFVSLSTGGSERANYKGILLYNRTPVQIYLEEGTYVNFSLENNPHYDKLLNIRALVSPIIEAEEIE